MDHGATGRMSEHSEPAHRMKRKKPVGVARKPSSPAAMTGMDHGEISSAHMGHEMAGHDTMVGFLGPYMMARDASGTSWQPDTSPHEGLHQQFEAWSVMTHGSINLNYDRQPGPPGAEKTFVGGMLMTTAQRPLGDGTLGVRAMLSPDPLMGETGYPLLLATGETADGVPHLVDRQHPHDLFMELAATYSRNITAELERLRLCRLSRRTRARSAGVHAPYQRHGQPRGADQPSLAGFDPHHVRGRDGRHRPRQLEVRSFERSAAGSPTSTATTSSSRRSTVSRAA